MNRIPYAAMAMIFAVLISPPASTAQQAGKVYRLGYLSPLAGIESADEAFRQGLRELGYVEGKNLVIEWRFAKGNGALFPRLATEIVQLNVDCILAVGIGAISAAKRATV